MSAKLCRYHQPVGKPAWPVADPLQPLAKLWFPNGRFLMPTVSIALSQFARQASDAVGMLKTLANESRLLVLCYLIEAEELTVGELVEKVGLSQSALSQHLARLRSERLVTTRKHAQTVFYRISDPKAGELLALLHDLFCPELGRHDGAHSEREQT
jgi:DNA-binding transcriptional ArsR family regulator